MAGTSIAERGLREKSASAAGGGGRSRHRLQPQGLPWIMPALVLCVGLIYYCIWYTAVISTWDWDGIDPNPERVGAENYVQIAQDPIFWQTIRHTIVFFVVTFVVQTALGLIFAVLLHSKVKFAVVYKVIIFIPVVLAPAIMAPVFRRIYAPDGQFNWLLEQVGLGFLAQPWIGQESTALAVIMAVTVWQWTGLTFVLTSRRWGRSISPFSKRPGSTAPATSARWSTSSGRVCGARPSPWPS
jgi:raffinose/stachyose/melibiose transport system permease protein